MPGASFSDVASWVQSLARRKERDGSHHLHMKHMVAVRGDSAPLPEDLQAGAAEPPSSFCRHSIIADNGIGPTGFQQYLALQSSPARRWKSALVKASQIGRGLAGSHAARQRVTHSGSMPSLHTYAHHPYLDGAVRTPLPASPLPAASAGASMSSSVAAGDAACLGGVGTSSPAPGGPELPALSASVAAGQDAHLPKGAPAHPPSPRTAQHEQQQQQGGSTPPVGAPLDGCQALLLRTEHWLEVADPRHRYGSNLRLYFDHWLSLDDPSCAGHSMTLVVKQKKKKKKKKDGLDREPTAGAADPPLPGGAPTGAPAPGINSAALHPHAEAVRQVGGTEQQATAVKPSRGGGPVKGGEGMPGCPPGGSSGRGAGAGPEGGGAAGGTWGAAGLPRDDVQLDHQDSVMWSLEALTQRAQHHEPETAGVSPFALTPPVPPGAASPAALPAVVAGQPVVGAAGTQQTATAAVTAEGPVVVGQADWGSGGAECHPAGNHGDGGGGGPHPSLPPWSSFLARSHTEPSLSTHRQQLLEEQQHQQEQEEVAAEGLQLGGEPQGQGRAGGRGGGGGVVSKDPEQSRDNFFRWLDYGEGRFVDLGPLGGPSREKLEAERVIYLTRDQLAHYEVVVQPSTGLLCYCLSGAILHTSGDAMLAPGATHPELAAPAQDPLPPPQEQQRHDSTGAQPGPGAAAAGAGDGAGDGRQAYISAAVVQEHAAPPCTVQDAGETAAVVAAAEPAPGDGVDGAGLVLAAADKIAKWIYVVDVDGRLYVHPKVRGKFHHSSFLRGAAVLSAGAMSVLHGRLIKLTADSGHYWPTPIHFRWLYSHLQALGADLNALQDILFQTKHGAP